ncbi:hypothetical protein Tco_0769939 [Tanacetum coccineum]|uniref:Uncharacterized protein n=1 Tax=Tanacetum coccineum TaxID=301880 RepID=A0ABQ4ZEE5_9ASTR
MRITVAFYYQKSSEYHDMATTTRSSSRLTRTPFFRDREMPKHVYGRVFDDHCTAVFKPNGLPAATPGVIKPRFDEYLQLIATDPKHTSLLNLGVKESARKIVDVLLGDSPRTLGRCCGDRVDGGGVVGGGFVNTCRRDDLELVGGVDSGTTVWFGVCQCRRWLLALVDLLGLLGGSISGGRLGMRCRRCQFSGLCVGRMSGGWGVGCGLVRFGGVLCLGVIGGIVVVDCGGGGCFIWGCGGVVVFLLFGIRYDCLVWGECWGMLVLGVAPVFVVVMWGGWRVGSGDVVGGVGIWVDGRSMLTFWLMVRFVLRDKVGGVVRRVGLDLELVGDWGFGVGVVGGVWGLGVDGCVVVLRVYGWGCAETRCLVGCVELGFGGWALVLRGGLSVGGVFEWVWGGVGVWGRVMLVLWEWGGVGGWGVSFFRSGMGIGGGVGVVVLAWVWEGCWACGRGVGRGSGGVGGGVVDFGVLGGYVRRVKGCGWRVCSDWWCDWGGRVLLLGVFGGVLVEGWSDCGVGVGYIWWSGWLCLCGWVIDDVRFVGGGRGGEDCGPLWVIRVVFDDGKVEGEGLIGGVSHALVVGGGVLPWGGFLVGECGFWGWAIELDGGCSGGGWREGLVLGLGCAWGWVEVEWGNFVGRGLRFVAVVLGVVFCLWVVGFGVGFALRDSGLGAGVLIGLHWLRVCGGLSLVAWVVVGVEVLGLSFGDGGLLGDGVGVRCGMLGVVCGCVGAVGDVVWPCLVEHVGASPVGWCGLSAVGGELGLFRMVEVVLVFVLFFGLLLVRGFRWGGWWGGVFGVGEWWYLWGRVGQGWGGVLRVVGKVVCLCANGIGVLGVVVGGVGGFVCGYGVSCGGGLSAWCLGVVFVEVGEITRGFGGFVVWVGSLFWLFLEVCEYAGVEGHGLGSGLYNSGVWSSGSMVSGGGGENEACSAGCRAFAWVCLLGFGGCGCLWECGVLFGLFGFEVEGFGVENVAVTGFVVVRVVWGGVCLAVKGWRKGKSVVCEVGVVRGWLEAGWWFGVSFIRGDLGDYFVGMWVVEERGVDCVGCVSLGGLVLCRLGGFVVWNGGLVWASLDRDCGSFVVSIGLGVGGGCWGGIGSEGGRAGCVGFFLGGDRCVVGIHVWVRGGWMWREGGLSLGEGVGVSRCVFSGCTVEDGGGAVGGRFDRGGKCGVVMVGMLLLGVRDLEVGAVGMGVLGTGLVGCGVLGWVLLRVEGPVGLGGCGFGFGGWVGCGVFGRVVSGVIGLLAVEGCVWLSFECCSGSGGLGVGGWVVGGGGEWLMGLGGFAERLSGLLMIGESLGIFVEKWAWEMKRCGAWFVRGVFAGSGGEAFFVGGVGSIRSGWWLIEAWECALEVVIGRGDVGGWWALVVMFGGFCADGVDEGRSGCNGGFGLEASVVVVWFGVVRGWGILEVGGVGGVVLEWCGGGWSIGWVCCGVVVLLMLGGPLVMCVFGIGVWAGNVIVAWSCWGGRNGGGVVECGYVVCWGVLELGLWVGSGWWVWTVEGWIVSVVVEVVEDTWVVCGLGFEVSVSWYGGVLWGRIDGCGGVFVGCGSGGVVELFGEIFVGVGSGVMEFGFGVVVMSGWLGGGGVGLVGLGAVVVGCVMEFFKDVEVLSGGRWVCGGVICGDVGCGGLGGGCWELSWAVRVVIVGGGDATGVVGGVDGCVKWGLLRTYVGVVVGEVWCREGGTVHWAGENLIGGSGVEWWLLWWGFDLVCAGGDWWFVCGWCGGGVGTLCIDLRGGVFVLLVGWGVAGCAEVCGLRGGLALCVWWFEGAWLVWGFVVLSCGGGWGVVVGGGGCCLAFAFGGVGRVV